MALCGANLVRIAALDEVRALVVGGGPFGPWSIWMEASKLRRVEDTVTQRSAQRKFYPSHEPHSVAP